MEKVEFQLEATLPELKDLYDKGLFSRHEIDQITKRRTAFETALIRRVIRKDDFFKYAEYEINLERLRKVRWKKLKYHINPPPPSASTYSLPRRTLYILKRATNKFPGDLGVWLAYVEYAAREGMTKVVAKGLNSALQHHPLSPTLYLLLSYHHLHPGAPLPRSSIPSTSTLDLPSANSAAAIDSAGEASSFSLEGTGPARTTLLLGLRLLPRSHILWREYVKLELGWVEGLRRRWRVLGIAPITGESSTTEGNTEGSGSNSETFDGDAEALAGGQDAFGPEGEDARRSILSGQLVVHALESALDKLKADSPAGSGETDGLAFRASLLTLLRAYPSPLRTKAISLIYADLERATSISGYIGARARLILITCDLYDREYNPEMPDTPDAVVLSGVDLVEQLGKIAREIRAVAKKSSTDSKSAWADVAGEWLTERIEQSSDNAELRAFLFSTLKTLVKSSLSPSPALLARHLELVRAYDPASTLSTTRSHASAHPNDPTLQLARVLAETSLEPDTDLIRAACSESAIRATRTGLSAEDQERVVEIWRTWAQWEDAREGSSTQAWKRLLRDSLRSTGVPSLHPILLAEYFSSTLRQGAAPLTSLSQIVAAYHPTPDFFTLAFPALASLSGTQAHLSQLYVAWRAVCRSPSDRVTAALTWAQWLVERGRGRDAHGAVDIVRREVRENEEAMAQLETGWKSLLDDVERRTGADEVIQDNDSSSEESGESDDDEDDGEDDEGDDEGDDEDDEGSDLIMI